MKRSIRKVASTDDIDIPRAVELLRAGQLVAFPTETVYGLGADASNEQAVLRIFAAKGRPTNHPLIVHIGDRALLTVWAREVSPAAQRLADSFWPGPLTLIVPRAAQVLDAVTGGQDTVGLRCPAHPVAQALLRACAEFGILGLAAPSANRFGHVSPTIAAHVREEFGAQIPLLDGGACEVGIESTIVDVSGGAPRILRPGMLAASTVDEVLAGTLVTAVGEVPRVSGSLAAHYAPRTPLELVASHEMSARIRAARAANRRLLVLTRTADVPDAAVPRRTLPLAPAAYAQALYAVLRHADNAKVDLILVESVPTTPEWQAIADRLQRAAYGAGRDA